MIGIDKEILSEREQRARTYGTLHRINSKLYARRIPVVAAAAAAAVDERTRTDYFVDCESLRHAVDRHASVWTTRPADRLRNRAVT